MLQAIVQTVEESIQDLGKAQQFLRQSRDPTTADRFHATDDIESGWLRLVRTLIRDPAFETDLVAVGRDTSVVPAVGTDDEERMARQLIVACASFVQAKVVQIRRELEGGPRRTELDMRVEPAFAQAEMRVVELLNHAETRHWRNLLSARRESLASSCATPAPPESANREDRKTLLVWLAGQRPVDWSAGVTLSRPTGSTRWRGPLELRYLAVVLDSIRSSMPPAPPRRSFRVRPPDSDVAGSRIYRVEEAVLPFSVVVNDPPHTRDWVPSCTLAGAEDPKQPSPAVVVNTCVLVASVDFADMSRFNDPPQAAPPRPATALAGNLRLPRCWATGPVGDWNRAIELIDAVQVRARLAGLRALVAVGQRQAAQRQAVVDVLCEHLRGHRRRARCSDISERERILVQELLVGHLRPPTREQPACEYWGGIDLNLDHAHLHDLSLQGAQVRSARFRQARFSGRTDLSEARFSEEAVFTNAVFVGAARFDSARFAADAVFENVRFLDSAAFDRTTFDGDARFDRSRFEGGASFARARIEGDARFNGTAVLAGLDEYDLRVAGTIRGPRRYGGREASEPQPEHPSSVVA